jgi:hypothetical protein
MLKDKERPKALLLRITVEMLTELLFNTNYKILPEDTNIHSIHKNQDFFTPQYSVILTSEQFPIVPEGSIPQDGKIHFDTENKVAKILPY